MGLGWAMYYETKSGGRSIARNSRKAGRSSRQMASALSDMASEVGGMVEGVFDWLSERRLERLLTEADEAGEVGLVVLDPQDAHFLVDAMGEGRWSPRRRREWHRVLDEDLVTIRLSADLLADNWGIELVPLPNEVIAEIERAEREEVEQVQRLEREEAERLERRRQEIEDWNAEHRRYKKARRADKRARKETGIKARECSPGTIINGYRSARPVFHGLERELWELERERKEGDIVNGHRLERREHGWEWVPATSTSFARLEPTS